MCTKDENWLNITCEICGKKLHRKPYFVNRAEHHYCSVACHREAKKIYMVGEKNHQYGLRGELNASYKGRDKITKYGYRQIQVWEHPFAVGAGHYVLEHRLVAEKYLLDEKNSVEINGKKYLSPEYIVHHINGDRLDNRVENLQVMTASQHQSLHDTIRLATCKRDEKGRFQKWE